MEQEISHLSPTNACLYVEEIDSESCWQGLQVSPEVNLRGFITHMPLSYVNKTGHSGFEIQRTAEV